MAPKGVPVAVFSNAGILHLVDGHAGPEVHALHVKGFIPVKHGFIGIEGEGILLPSPPKPDGTIDFRVLMNIRCVAH